ncbi:MAG: hypothetical protein MR656_08980, partial [Bacteroidales bacterium]|nr:hypothetical protein [Bacteroidales bacterium]
CGEQNPCPPHTLAPQGKARHHSPSIKWHACYSTRAKWIIKETDAHSISFFYGWGKEKWDKEGGSKDFFVNLLFKYDGRRI